MGDTSQDNTTQPEDTGVENLTVETPPENTEPPKKRRGRPPKNPALIQEGISGSSSAPKSDKPRKKKSDTDIASLAKQIVGLHALGAMVSGIPEMQINDQEGLLLAGGVVAVAEQYDLSIDGKTGAALQLLGAAAMVYAPRVFAFNARAKKARENNAETVPFNMVNPENGTPAS